MAAGGAPRPHRGRWGAALAVGLALMFAGLGAVARPFTVDDLLRLETIGQAATDPKGRWLVFERTDPYETAPRFDADILNELAVSRLYLVDLQHPAPARPLLAREEGQGVVLGPFSPSGSRLAVYRFRDRRWELGVVELPAGGARWLGVTPEDAMNATTVHWLGDASLLVLARRDGRPDWVKRRIWEGPSRLPALWARTAAGLPSSSVYGSGAHRQGPPAVPGVQLLRLDLDRGARRSLAEGDFRDMETSGDGRRVALLEAAGALQPRADAQVQGDYGLALERHRLAVIDLATGALLRPPGDVDLMDSLLTWSPEGNALLAYGRPRGAPWSAGGLVRYDAATNHLTAMPMAIRPELRVRPEGVWAGWMGHDPVVFGRPAASPGARADWFRLGSSGPVNLTRGLPAPGPVLSRLDREGLVLVAGGRAWRVSREGAPARLSRAPAMAWIAPRPRFERRAAAQPPSAGPVVLLETSPAGQRLRALDGPKSVVLPLPAGARALAYVPQAQAVVTLTGVQARRLRLGVLTAAGSTEAAVTNPHLADVEMARVHAIEHPGPDGRILRSWIFLPPTLPADGRAPPLIVRPYLGTTFRSPFPATPYVDELTISVEALVGRGYAVLLPSLPRAPGSNPVAGVAERVLAIVDAAARDPALRGAFDPARLALWGHSYGGYTVAAIASQTDRFSAAIAQSAPLELAGMWGTFQPNWRVAPETGIRVALAAGWTEDAQGAMGAPPWAAPDRYVAASPLYQAGRIHTPLLLFHGDQDFIPMAQAEMLFSALYRQDRDAMLVTYWGEGHALSSPGTVRDRYTRAFAWLTRYMAPAPAEAAVCEPSRTVCEARPASPAPGPASGAPRIP